MGADLITLQDYKDAEGISGLENDTKFNSLISSVSQLVKTYCANSFIDYYSADKVDIFNLDYATSNIQVTESPLISVSLVEVRTKLSEAYTALNEGAYEYYVDLEGDVISRTTEDGYAYWEMGPGAVRVTYRAGYATIPDDLKLAVIDLINYYYKEEYKPRRTIGGSSIANDPSSTQWRNVGFPDHIKRVLDLYKQIQV